MQRKISGFVSSLCLLVLLGQMPARADEPRADAGAPFGALPLVDEVDCGAPADEARFAESAPGVSQVQTILGRPCRVLPSAGDAKFFAYRLGKGKGLQPGAAYLLEVDFPEDQPRSMFFMNRGAEMARGVHTGASLGDVLYTFTNNNSESLRMPLSGKYRTWKMLFFLHDRWVGLSSPKGNNLRSEKPEDGFWVITTQSRAENDPLSNGAAVARIRLFSVPDVAKYNQPLRLPPAGLPQRHLFFREEMADGVVSSPKPEERGLDDTTKWFEYKARLMQFLGLNTYAKDLLEFGSNQGWDCGDNDDWYYRAKDPGRWDNMLKMLTKYSFTVLPYYEYAGGMGKNGLGKQKRAQTLSGSPTYTHITWTERANVDITDPDALADANRLLDATILKYKEQVHFEGAWFRPRPSAMPMSFADATLARFSKETNGGQAVTRADLQADKKLRAKYYDWWFLKRRDFIDGLRDHLRQGGLPDAVILYTPDASEPGHPLRGPHKVVTDSPEEWDKILSQPPHVKVSAIAYDDVVHADGQLTALTSPVSTWGKWEWQHASPQADPANYKDREGEMMTFSMSRAYSVASPKAFDSFRTPTGLAVIQHFPLNEGSMDKQLGYFASDMEYAGPYCMMAEARAVANGDPRYLGFLASTSYNRGFPEYVRPFNAAFLSLPALPSTILAGAASDAEVVVRSIPTPKSGTYLAVVNTGLVDKTVSVSLPAKGTVTDAATGEPVAVNDGKVQLTMYPFQLRSLRIQ